MKENNQDSGGKISGLVIGALLLQTGVGMHLDSPSAVRDAVTTGLGVFLVLSLVHVVPLYVSVRQLTPPGSSWLTYGLRRNEQQQQQEEEADAEQRPKAGLTSDTTGDGAAASDAAAARPPLLRWLARLMLLSSSPSRHV